MRRHLLYVLLLLVFAVAALGQSGVTRVHSYQLREPHDRGVRFVTAVTPEQDLLSFVPKANGVWRLTRVRGWLSEKPLEQTIDIPGIAAPREPSASAPRVISIGTRLLVTADGRFAVAIATGGGRSSAGITTHDDFVSVVALHEFRVLKTIQGPVLTQEPARGGDGAQRSRWYDVDPVGHLVVRTRTSLRTPTSFCDNKTGQPVRVSTTEFGWDRKEINLQFLTLPDLAKIGECNYSETLACGGVTIRDDPGEACDALLSRTQGSSVGLADFLNIFSKSYKLKDPLKHRCPTTGITRDGRFEKESCFGFPTRTFWGNTGKPKEFRENILSLRTGRQVGTVDELANDSVQSNLVDYDGQDYLLVVEGGTRLKIYAITE